MSINSTNQILTAMSALPRSSASNAGEKGVKVVEEKENGPELKYQHKPAAPGMGNLLRNCLNPDSPKYTPMD